MHWLNNRGHSYVRLIFCVTDFQHTESIDQSIFFIAFCFAVSLCCLKVPGTGLLKHRWWQITRNYIWFLCDHFVFFHFVWPFFIHVFQFAHLCSPLSQHCFTLCIVLYRPVLIMTTVSYIKRSHLFCDCFVVLICPSLGWQTIHLKFIIYLSYFSKQIDWWPTFRGLLCEVSHLHAHEPKTLQLLWDCHFLIHFCVFTNPQNTLPMFLRRSIILTY